MKDAAGKPLLGARVAVTRPAGTAAAMARRLRALGAEAFSLPGSSLRAAQDAATARAALRQALACDCTIFVSPVAVRFAAKLVPLRIRGEVIAPGEGTAAALKRAGLESIVVPACADSEGMLALRELQRVRGKRIGIVGAPGGRGVLQRELGARGAHIVVANVYRRVPARLDRRHLEPLLRGRAPLYVALSSAESLEHLLRNLPAIARRGLLAGTAIASSARLQGKAKNAGFERVLRAASAHEHDLIAAIVSTHAGARR